MTSANVARTRPSVRPERVTDVRPALRVIEGARPRRTLVPLAIIAVVALLIGVVVPLVINTRMAQTAYEIRTMQVEINGLDAEAWTTRTRLRELASPENLEKAAKDLGMVPAATSGVISLEAGTVEGGQAAQ